MSRPIRSCPLAALIALSLAPGLASAAGFVYEGRLDDGGAPANGRYDLRLSPYPDAKSGAALGAPIVFEDVPVVDGRFRVDFDLPLVSAASAWIEVGVREGAAVGAFSAIPGRSEAASAKAIGACWSSTGDSATNPALNFLGTTDAQPLVLRVQNQQVVRFEPSSQLFNGVPMTANVVAGSPLNGLFAGVRGAVIAGGGAPPDSDPLLFDEAPNRVNDDFGTIGGGFANLAGDQTIGLNSASGATVGGGVRNQASGAYAVVAGGATNRAASSGDTVGGGFLNAATGGNSTVAGGQQNTASGNFALISGGSENLASANWAVVAGGRMNTASGPSAFLGGGSSNSATASGAVVAGGIGNQAIAGNAFVLAGSGNDATADASAVVGGVNNMAAGQSAMVAGGLSNCAGGRESWAAGHRAKVRLGTGGGVSGASGCNQVPTSGDLDGDEGTFVWNSTVATDFVSTGPRQFLVNSPNGVAINVNDPAGSTLRVAGTLRVDTLGTSASTTLCRNASNQISGCSSSARYKEHITDLDLGLAVVERLRPVAYEWKQTHEADIGFVAEEIAQIDPRLVTRNAAGEIEGVKYERLTAVLAAALQQVLARSQIEQARFERELASVRAEAADRDAALVERLRFLESAGRRPDR